MLGSMGLEVVRYINSCECEEDLEVSDAKDVGDDCGNFGSSSTSHSGLGLQCPKTFSVVRMTGLPFRPMPSFFGLPGAQTGSWEMVALGRLIEQLTHPPSSPSAFPGAVRRSSESPPSVLF